MKVPPSSGDVGVVVSGVHAEAAVNFCDDVLVP
jgi:hypothetical protein